MQLLQCACFVVELPLDWGTHFTPLLNDKVVLDRVKGLFWATCPLIKRVDILVLQVLGGYQPDLFFLVLWNLLMPFLVGSANAVCYMNPGHLALTLESHHVLVVPSLGWGSCPSLFRDLQVHRWADRNGLSADLALHCCSSTGHLLVSHASFASKLVPLEFLLSRQMELVVPGYCLILEKQRFAFTPFCRFLSFFYSLFPRLSPG